MALVKYSDTNLPTPAEIRATWCFGLPLSNDTGGTMDDKDLQKFISAAIKEVERKLSIFLKPTAISCGPEERGLVLGTDYEVEEPPYDYEIIKYRAWGFMQFRQRPLKALTGLTLKLPNGMTIIDFITRPEWIKLYKKAAQMHIVPYAGDPTLYYLLGGTQSGFPFFTGQMNSNLPQMIYVDYVAGLGDKNPDYDPDQDDDDASPNPQYIIAEDIRNVVAKIASCDALGIASEAWSAGIASQSTSIDGLSESQSLTASAENMIYSAHIAQYRKDIDAFFSPKGSSARASERGLTFIVL